MKNKLSPNNQLTLSIKIAAECHYGQTDRGGAPYIMHPFAVMYKLKLKDFDFEILSIGMLHDAIEDSEITFDDLRKAGFSERVITALMCLTHDRSIAYEQYIENVAVCNDAIIVKLCDLEHNMELARLDSIGPKDITRINKYRTAYSYLSKRLE